MPEILTRFLRVQPGEGRKVLQFALLGALLQAGLATGMSAADSLFLANLGADKLPVVYLLTPAMMLGYIPAFSWLLGRYRIDRVFDVTLALLVAGGVFFYFALHPAPGGASLPPLLYYAAKLYAGLWYIGLYTLLWNFIDCYFDLVDAKRLFGLFAAGSATGAIGGGILVNTLSGRLGVHSLFLCWAGFALATVPVLIWTRRSWPKLTGDEIAEPTEPAAATGVGSLARVILGSRYVVVLTLVIFCTLVTATVCEYQYLTIFSQLADETSLAELFGKLYIFVNAFNLVVTLFVFPRLVAELGVRNTALIQPCTFLAVFALLLLGNSFAAGLAGFLAFQGIMTSIDFNNANLFFNSLPSRDKNQIRTFIEGLAEPLATATAGVGLLYFAPRLSPESLSGGGFAGAIVCLGLVLVLRVDYLKVMVAGVKRGWLDFARGPEALLASLSEGDLAFVAAQARTGARAPRLAAIAVLGRNDRTRALEALLEYLADAAPADRLAARPLVAQLLAGNDSAIVQRCMLWLDEHPEALDATLLEEFGPRRLVPEPSAVRQIRSPRPAERAAGASALWSSWQLPHSLDSLQTIQTLLGGGPEEMAAALRGLGRLGDPRYLHNVAQFFRHPSPAVRHEAIVAARQLATRESAEIVSALLAVLPETKPEDRLLVLETLGQIGDTDSILPLLAGGTAFTPHERRCAEHLILQMGLRSVPILVAVVQDPNYPFISRSIAARALGKLAFPQFESLAWPLIERTIQRCYESIGHRHTLAQIPHPGPGMAMLAFVFDDRPQLQLEMILEFLAVVGRLPNYESILLALRAGTPKDRGLAIETIEAACHRNIFRRLLPLLDGRRAAAQLEFGRAAGLGRTLSVEDLVAAELHSNFPLASTIALQAQYELDPARATIALALRLQRATSPLLVATALQLLARPTGSSGSAAEDPTPVELLHLLVQNEFFADWGLRSLEIVAPGLVVRSFRDGETVFGIFHPADGLHYVLSGEATIGPPERTVGPGSLIGESALLGETLRSATARARGPLRTVLVPASVVRQCAAIYPQLALSLLRRKLAA